MFHRRWQALSTVKMFSKSFPHSNIIAIDAKRCKKITTLHAIGSIKFFKSPKPIQSNGNTHRMRYLSVAINFVCDNVLCYVVAMFFLAYL